MDDGGWRDEAKWPAIITASIDAMTRLEKSLRAHVKSLKLGTGD